MQYALTRVGARSENAALELSR